MRFGVVMAAAVIALTAYVVLKAVQHRRLATRHKPLPPECKLGPTTAGIDVSYYQGEISWSRVRRAGVHYAFIRVSDGTTVADTKFDANWSGAKRANVLRGAYQFFRPEQNPVEQANVLINKLRAKGIGELPPVIDIEVTGGLPLATFVANARLWIEHVRSQLGVEPIVYTNYGMFRWGGAEPLARQELWLAHYTNQCPSIPPPWKQWAFWQYTENGRVDGIDGPVDLDVFAGPPEELRRRFRP